MLGLKALNFLVDTKKMWTAGENCVSLWRAPSGLLPQLDVVSNNEAGREATVTENIPPPSRRFFLCIKHQEAYQNQLEKKPEEISPKPGKKPNHTAAVSLC